MHGARGFSLEVVLYCGSMRNEAGNIAFGACGSPRGVRHVRLHSKSKLPEKQPSTPALEATSPNSEGQPLELWYTVCDSVSFGAFQMPVLQTLMSLLISP